MTSEIPESDQDGPAPTPAAPAAIAATEEPVQLKVALVEDDRVPDGMVCMGTFRNGRLVARSVLSPQCSQLVLPSRQSASAACSASHAGRGGRP
jgi:hypothetical protein